MVLDRATIDDRASQPDREWSELKSRSDLVILDVEAEPAEDDELALALERRDLLVPNRLLVASPYRDDDYAPLDEATDRFALEKWAALSTLCGFLGVKYVTVQVVEDTESHTQVTMAGGGSKGPVKADGSAKYDHVEKFAGQLRWEDHYEGGQLDLDLARDYMRNSGLEVDPVVRSLVEARAHDGNRLQRRLVNIDLNSESARSIEAALEVGALTFGGLAATLDSVKENKTHYRVQLEILFHNEGQGKVGPRNGQ